MEIITNIMMLFSKELCGFSVGDYVISKLADLGTGRVWKEIKHRLPKDDKALETQLYDAIEKSIICYSNVSYNSDQIAPACEIIFGMWIAEGHLSEKNVKKALTYLNPNLIAERNVKVWCRLFYEKIAKKDILYRWYILNITENLYEQISIRDMKINDKIIQYMEHEERNGQKQENISKESQKKIREQISHHILKENVCLQQIYISMHGKLQECNMWEERLGGCGLIVDTTEYIWNWYERKNVPLLLIHGEPGIGKSSLVKMIAATMTSSAKTNGMVAVVELHRLSFGDTETALETVRKYIEQEYPYFLDINYDGKRLLIIDGLDEIKYKVYEKANELVRNSESYRWEVPCTCIISGRTQIVKKAAEDIRCETLEILPLFMDEYELKNCMLETEDPVNLLQEDLRELYWNKLVEAFGLKCQMPGTNARFEELSKSPLLLFLVIWTIKHTGSEFEDFKNTAELYNAIFKHIYTREYNRTSEQEIYFKTKEYREYQQMLHYLGGCAYKYNSRSISIGLLYDYCKQMGEEDLCKRWIQLHQNDNPSKLVLLFFLREEQNEMDSKKSEIEFIHKTFYEYLAAISVIESLHKIIEEYDMDNMLKKLFYILSDNRLNEEILKFMGEIIENETLEVDYKRITKIRFSKILTEVFRKGFHKDYPFFNSQNSYTEIRNGGSTSESQWERGKIEVHSYNECKEKVRIYENNLENILKIFIERFSKMENGELRIVLTSIDLSGANMMWWTFDYTDLRGSDFNGSMISRASFKNCIMENSSFLSVVGDCAEFGGADLCEADFTGAQLVAADFTAAELKNTDFELADLEGAYFGETIFSGTRFRSSNLTAANFDDAVFVNVDFNSADLTRADFTGVQIVSANWDNCIMEKTKLNGVKLTKFDLNDPNIIEMLAEADLEYADWSGVDEEIAKYLQKTI